MRKQRKLRLADSTLVLRIAYGKTKWVSSKPSRDVENNVQVR
jgi:hypothetical protein